MSKKGESVTFKQVRFPASNVQDHASLLIQNVISEHSFGDYARAAVNEKIQRDKLRLAAIRPQLVQKDGEKDGKNMQN